MELCKHDTPFFRTARCEYEQGLGQVRPNKITSKLARVADVKSRWSTTFSRIENLWPRDGSCPLPLRLKVNFGNCCEYVKIKNRVHSHVKVFSAHVSGSPFAPNEVPAPVLQRRWRKSRYHVRTAHAVVKVQLSRKEKYRPRSTGEGFCRGKTAAK